MNDRREVFVHPQEKPKAKPKVISDAPKTILRRIKKGDDEGNNQDEE